MKDEYVVVKDGEYVADYHEGAVMTTDHKNAAKWTRAGAEHIASLIAGSVVLPHLEIGSRVKYQEPGDDDDVTFEITELNGDRGFMRALLDGFAPALRPVYLVQIADIELVGD